MTYFIYIKTDENEALQKIKKKGRGGFSKLCMGHFVTLQFNYSMM